MLNQKRQTIELGGKGIGSSHSFLSLNSGSHSPSSQSINIASRQVMISPHKISNKVSPNKQKLPPKKLSRQNSNLQNSMNTFQMQNSKASVLTRLGERALFQERSNIISPESKGIIINYSTGVTSAESKNSSFHQKEVISPNKILELPPKSHYELQLQRKLKILELRISQLHRQKQQSAAKLNEQNRKVYHQNVNLKQKVNQLAKALQKVHKVEALTSERSHASSTETYALQKSNIEIETLKKEIKRLQQCLAQRLHIQNQLTIKNLALSANLTTATSLCQNLEEEVKRLNDLIKNKSAELQQVSRDIQLQKQHYQHLKLSQDNQIQNIRQLTFQNEQRYKIILKEYESKIQEYQIAYNSNQQLIHHLEQQLRNFQNVSQSVIKQQNIEESVHIQLASQCQQLQNNLLSTISEKDMLIQQLNAQNRQLIQEIQQKQLQLKRVLNEDKDKSQKLELTSQLLNKVTVNFQELSQKYRQISEKYEIQKINFAKSQISSQKCKKCEQLLKTVLRLNSHLNLKKG